MYIAILEFYLTFRDFDQKLVENCLYADIFNNSLAICIACDFQQIKKDRILWKKQILIELRKNST
jgi:hypothetical protein